MAVDFADLLREVTEFSSYDIRVGFQNDESSDEGLSIATIAAYNEFGTEDIPARPFLSTALDEARKEIASRFEDEMGEILEGNRTAIQAARRLGIFGATIVKKRIRDSQKWAEENADATIDKKGSSKPLVDTGEMLGAVTWAVLKGGTVVESG